MKVEIINNRVCGILLEEFPERYVFFHSGVKEGGTIPLEKCGKNLLEKCFEGNPTSIVFQGEVKDFIREILQWAVDENDYDTLLGYIYSPEQPEEVVARRVCEATMALQNGKLGDAVQILDELKGIGLSIGSKILRMMSPETSGAFDDRHLQRKLSYPADSNGYANFCEDCVVVAEQMNEKGIEHEPSIADKKMRGSPKWLAADVEAVVFDCLRGRNP